MTDDIPALVFAYQGYYVSIFSNEQYWWFDICTDDQVINWENAIIKEEIGVGDLVEYIIEKINNLSSLNFVYLN